MDTPKQEKSEVKNENMQEIEESAKGFIEYNEGKNHDEEVENKRVTFFLLEKLSSRLL